SARDAVLLRAAGKLRALRRHDERLEPYAERRDPPAAGEHADLALAPHGSREQRESRFPLLIGVPERRGADELRRHRPQLEQQAAQRVAVRIRGRDRDRAARASSVDPPRIAPLPTSSSSMPACGALPRSSRTVTAASLPASAATLGGPTTRSAAPRAPPPPRPPGPRGPVGPLGAAGLLGAPRPPRRP